MAVVVQPRMMLQGEVFLFSIGQFGFKKKILGIFPKALATL